MKLEKIETWNKVEIFRTDDGRVAVVGKEVNLEDKEIVRIVDKPEYNYQRLSIVNVD